MTRDRLPLMDLYLLRERLAADAARAHRRDDREGRKKILRELRAATNEAIRLELEARG